MKKQLTRFALILGMLCLPQMATADMIKNLAVDVECTENVASSQPRQFRIVSDENASALIYQGKSYAMRKITAGTEGGNPYTQIMPNWGSESDKSCPLSMINLFPDAKSESGKAWIQAFHDGNALENFSIDVQVKFDEVMVWDKEYGQYLRKPKEKPFTATCFGRFQALPMRW